MATSDPRDILLARFERLIDLPGSNPFPQQHVPSKRSRSQTLSLDVGRQARSCFGLVLLRRGPLTVVRTFAAVLSFSVVFVVGRPGRAVSEALPPRVKETCAENARGVPLAKTYTTGSWGSIPPVLRKLPPGAELCGTNSLGLKTGAALIMSSLQGEDLGSFYRPLFQQIGCQPLACEVRTIGNRETRQTTCTCRGDHIVGNLRTDVRAEAYVLSIFP